MAKIGLAAFVVMGVFAQCHMAEARRAGRRRNEGSEFSRTVALSEDGYQSVARLRSDEDMKAFVRRVLRTFDREVSDEGPLSGFVQFYSGTKAVQSYEHMREELQRAPWTQPLSVEDAPAGNPGVVNLIGSSPSDAVDTQPAPRTKVTDDIRTSLMNQVLEAAAKDPAIEANESKDTKEVQEDDQKLKAAPTKIVETARTTNETAKAEEGQEAKYSNASDSQPEDAKVTGNQSIANTTASQAVQNTSDIDEARPAKVKKAAAVKQPAKPNLAKAKHAKAALQKANQAKAAIAKPSAQSPTSAVKSPTPKASGDVALEPRSKQQPKPQLRAGMHPQAKQTSASRWGVGSYLGSFFKKVVGSLTGSASSGQDSQEQAVPTKEAQAPRASGAGAKRPQRQPGSGSASKQAASLVSTAVSVDSAETAPADPDVAEDEHHEKDEEEKEEEEEAAKSNATSNNTLQAAKSNATSNNTLQAAKLNASSNHSSQAIVEENTTVPATVAADTHKAVATKNTSDPKAAVDPKTQYLNAAQARIEARRKAREEAAAKAKAEAAVKLEEAKQRRILQNAARAAQAAAARKAKQEALAAKRFAKRQAAERAANHSRALKSEMRLAVEQSFADAKASHAPLSKAAAPPNLTAMGPELSAPRFSFRRRQDPKFQLPDVDKLLANATHHFDHIASQTKELESQASSKLAAGRDALLELRQSFERKIEEKADESQAMRAINQKVKANITVVQQEVSEARKTAFTLRSAGNVLRKTLFGLSSKLSLTEEFLDASLNVTDDSEAEALIVLKPTTPAPTLEHFLNMAREELGLTEESNVADTVSLLQAGSRTVSRRTVFPEDQKPATVSDVLKGRLGKLLADQEKAGEELKSKFADLFGQAEALQRGILSEQQHLNATLASLVQQRSQLADAKDHLQVRLDALRERIAGFRAFAGKVDSNLADATVEADAMLTGVDLMEPIPLKKVTSLRATPKLRNRKRRAIRA